MGDLGRPGSTVAPKSDWCGLDALALDELLRWLQQDDLSEDSEGHSSACRVLVSCARAGIECLWRADPRGFRNASTAFKQWVLPYRFDFEYCDTIADFAVSVVEIISDIDVLREAVEALVHLGAGHNRWHVCDVTLPLLQGVRDHDHAVAALEALQASRLSEVQWTVSEFALRSMHPVLRNGLTHLLRSAS
jgi:hypothetical protein